MFAMREALRNIRRMPGSWAMTVLTLAGVLAFSGVFGVLAYHTRAALHELRAGIAVEGFFDPSVSSDDARGIVHEKVERIQGIGTVYFTTKEEALEKYKQASGEDVEAVLGMNPLPASVSVSAKDPTSARMRALESELRSIPGVVDVRGDLDLLSTMESRARTLDLLFGVLALALLLTAVFYVVTYTGYATLSRKEALATMQQLGATRSQLSLPFMLEAALGGFAGSVIACLLLAGSSKLGSGVLPPELHLLHGKTEYLAVCLGILLFGILLSGTIAYLSASWRLRRS